MTDPSIPSRPGRGAQALGAIAALVLLALLVAFAARLGWELGGRLLKLTDVDARTMGITLEEGFEFETNLLDIWPARYRVVAVRKNGHGVVADVERVRAPPQPKSRPREG